jgi:hypothetical protein
MMGKIFTAAIGCMLLLLTAHSAGTAAPNAPTNLTVTVNYDNANGTYSAVFDWRTPHGANSINTRVDGYKLYARDLSQNGSEFVEVGSTDRTTITIGDELNLCCTAYTFYVKANNSNDGGITLVESDESNRVSTVCGRNYNDGDYNDYLGTGEGEIVSNPPQKAQLGKEYHYDAMVLNDLHAHNNGITFSLARAPEGMSINATTGLVTWVPSEAGLYNVQIKAEQTTTKEVHDQIWTVQVSESVSGVPMTSSSASSVYPNPASSYLTVKLGATGSASDLQVSDVRGREVLGTTVQAGNEGYRLDVSSLATGTYFLHIKNTGGERVIPFNIVR